MRSTVALLTHVVLFILTVAPARAGQEEMRVDPYERLYGRPLSAHTALPSADISLSSRAAEQMANRTLVLLRRTEVANTSPFGGSFRTERSTRLRAVLDKLAENAQRSRTLLTEGRYEAAYLEASGHAYAQEIIVHFVDGFKLLAAHVNSQGTVAGATLPSRVPEARAQLERLHDQLRTFKPATASQLLALLDAYAEWHDMQVLLDLFARHPQELTALLKKEFSLTELDTPEDQRLFLSLFVEPFALPLVQIVVDDIQFKLQLSQTDSSGTLPPLTRRIDEAQLRQLATAYSEAAKWNFSRLDAMVAGRTLPREDPFEASWHAVEAVEITARQRFAQDHQDTVGLDDAFRLLAASFSSYRDSLYSIATLQVRLLDANSLAGSDSTEKATATPAGDRLLDRLVHREGFLARRAAAGARAELGYVPTPVVLDLRGGLDASSGDRDDRKRALGYAIQAAMEADLARALSTPPPCPEGNEAGCSSLSTQRDLSAEIRDCIQRLRDPQTGVIDQAKGFARKKSNFPDAVVEDIILDAINKTCLEADDRGDSISALFWLKYRSSLVDWYRKTVIFERNAERLFTPCVSRPDEELREREREEEEATRGDRVRKILCDLDQDDRCILDLHVNQGKTFREIGWMLGISEDGARKRFNAAAKRFRKVYGKPPEFSWLPTEKMMNFASL